MKQKNYARQFTLVQVLPSQISANADYEIDFPQTLDKLVMPPFVVLESGSVSNPLQDLGAILGIRINDPRAPILPFGMDPSCICEVTGPIDRIFVRMIGSFVANWYLYGLSGIEFKYTGAQLGGEAP